MFLLNENEQEFIGIIDIDLQYKMFLLNENIKIKKTNGKIFTIQNVSIK